MTKHRIVCFLNESKYYNPRVELVAGIGYKQSIFEL